MIRILVVLLFVQVAFAQTGRLDPHGSSTQDIRSVDIQKNSECTVCHTQGAKGLMVKPGWSCTSCHNSSPHSGAPEHMDKMYKHGSTVGKITCTSCHSPHRFGNHVDIESSGIIKNSKLEGKGLKVSPSQNPMLKTSCVECHKW